MNYNRFSKRFLVGALAVSLMLPACTNLETTEVDSIVIDDAGGATAGDPTALLESLYKDDMGALTDQANTYALFEHTTDEMIPPTRGVDWSDNGVWRQLYQHTWDPTHSYVLGAWNQLNQRAFKCTQILGSNPSVSEAAQAKFLRAFFMWHVMDLFGQVPFREFNEGVNDNPRVLTRAEAFDFIMKDLQEARPYLPEVGPSARNSTATRAAAATLIARMYLNKAVYTAANPEGPYTFDNADMDSVIHYCDTVTLMGYTLENEYFTNFSAAASKEIIFTSAAGTPENRWKMTLHYNQNPDGWNGFTTLADFYAKFEEDDARRSNGGPGSSGYVFDASDFPKDIDDIDNDNNKDEAKPYNALGRGFLIGQQYQDNGSILVDTRTQRPLIFTPDVPLTGAATDKGIRVIKYHPADRGQYIFFRYGDVYLMKAEALMRKGEASAALTMVNNLRAMRDASPLGALTEADMLDERGRELYWEGIRRVDQIRFGTYINARHEKEPSEAFRVLFPIPQQALDSNPNLQPNPGY